MGQVIELFPGTATGAQAPPGTEAPPGTPQTRVGGREIPRHSAAHPAPTIHRPEWFGTGRDSRRAAAAAVSRNTRRAARRTVFEVASTPRRGLRLLRWFLRGVAGHRDHDTGDWVGGWLGLILWCFAAKERADAHNQAREKPGAELSGTQKADQIAVWHSAVLVVPHIIGAAVLNHYGLPWALIFAPLVVGTTLYGWRTDPKPPPPIAAPRAQANVTIDTINNALRAVGLLTKPSKTDPTPDGVTLARMPRTVGGGQEIVFDLPPTVKAAAVDVIKERDRIAASLATPLPQLTVEPGLHAGQVIMWQADHDPFAGPPTDHPLLDHRGPWSVFDPVPYGTDARSRPVTVPLIGTSYLIGALPNAGKSSAARALASGVVLDPHAEIFVFDGKGGKDWSATARVATVYENGPARDQARALRDLLVEFIADGDRRFATMRELPDDQCPDNAITRTLHEQGMPFRFLIIDEGHRHIGDEEYGSEITRLLIDLVKGYRAAGYGLMFVTQDAESGISDRFTALRRVTGSRLALRVMDWQGSNMILGDQMNTRGWNAADILPSQQGTGILRADLETGGDTSGQVARYLRAYYTSAAQWRAICEHGAVLRERAVSPSTQVGVPDEPSGVLSLVCAALAEHGPLSASALLEHLPEPWSTLRPDHLGLELRALGLRSKQTNNGRRYLLEHAQEARREVRDDPVAPRGGPVGDPVVAPRGTTGSTTGHDGVHDGGTTGSHDGPYRGEESEEN